MSDVYGEDLIAMFETQIGVPRSGGYDSHNGDHPWAYYCEAGVESTGRNCGLVVPARGSATGAGLTEALAGTLSRDWPAHGDVVVFGPAFYYPYGHTGLWNADRQQLLGTLTDGTGVGYMNWGPATSGYAGKYTLDGVAAPKRGATPAPPPQTWFVQPDNPHQSPDRAEIGIGGGFLRFYNAVGIGLEPFVALGYALANEQQARVTDEGGVSGERTIQRFQRGTLIYQPEEPPPYDIVMALTSATITPV